MPPAARASRLGGREEAAHGGGDEKKRGDHAQRRRGGKEKRMHHGGDAAERKETHAVAVGGRAGRGEGEGTRVMAAVLKCDSPPPFSLFSPLSSSLYWRDEDPLIRCKEHENLKTKDRDSYFHFFFTSVLFRFHLYLYCI